MSAASGFFLATESTPAPVVPRRIHRYVTQPVESDPPELIRQILADEGRCAPASPALMPDRHLLATRQLGGSARQPPHRASLCQVEECSTLSLLGG